jgi:hypothetical protein
MLVHHGAAGAAKRKEDEQKVFWVSPMFGSWPYYLAWTAHLKKIVPLPWAGLRKET